MMGRQVSAAAAALFAILSANAHAESVEEFYRGKTITIVVPVSAGGVYGTFGQIFERHFGRHMPGSPNVVVTYMEGAGGVRGISFVYSAAQKDGTMLALPNTGFVATAVLEPVKVRYEPLKFNLLGGWGEAVIVLTLAHDAPAKRFEDTFKTEVILGSIGKGTTGYQVPAMLNDMLGTKFKIITGYQGGSPIRLAMERGEVHGWMGQWLGWRAVAPDWIRDKKIVNLMQMATRRQKDLADVPLLTEFAQNAEQRAIFEFISLASVTGQAFVAPPGVPADRVAAMEKAFAATLADPAFLADAEARNYIIDPLTAAEVRSATERMVNTPADIIEKTKKVMGIGGT
jgi:tripartite-type tricarboxylate transporter receptor subunit TctC